MSKLDIIRAWKDKEYRSSLSDKEQALLPENPAGQVELSASDLEEVDGGSWSATLTFVTAVSMAACASYFNGGTCNLGGSFGCC